MAILVPTFPLAAALGQDKLTITAPTVGALLDEVSRRVPAEKWEPARKAAIFVNGRNIHFMHGLATPLHDADVVWMAVPSAGG